MSKIRSNNSRQSKSSRLPSLSPHTTAWFSVDSPTNKILELERHPVPKSLCHCPEPLLRHQNGKWTVLIPGVVINGDNNVTGYHSLCHDHLLHLRGYEKCWQIYITSFHPSTNPEKLAQCRRLATSWILISAPPGNIGHWENIHTDFRPASGNIAHSELTEALQIFII